MNNTTNRTASSIIMTAAIEILDLSNDRMMSSAQLCLDDARACYARGDFHYAAQRALKSLAYSVGILHPAYAKAAATIG